ncbi:MAG: hypothetical protein WBV35_08830 [Steroidobacteraceae bacterium]
MFGADAREKLAGQVKDATEKITSNVAAVGIVALIALAVACGALYVSVRALQATRETI